MSPNTSTPFISQSRSRFWFFKKQYPAQVVAEALQKLKDAKAIIYGIVHYQIEHGSMNGAEGFIHFYTPTRYADIKSLFTAHWTSCDSEEKAREFIIAHFKDYDTVPHPLWSKCETNSTETTFVLGY